MPSNGAPSPLTGWRGVFACGNLLVVSDEAWWTEHREALATARANCLALIGNHYGHPVEATSADVLLAISAAIRAGFDLGAEYARRSTPPPPTDPELLSAAETLLRGLRRG